MGVLPSRTVPHERARVVLAALLAVPLAVLLAACTGSDGADVPEPGPNRTAEQTPDPPEDPDGTGDGDVPGSADRADGADDEGGTDDTAAPGVPGTADLPEFDDTTAAGELVPGFPADVVPVAEGAEVLASSARPDEETGMTALTLNLRSAQDAEALVELYRDALEEAGFESAGQGDLSALVAQLTFVRGTGEDAESLLVGVHDDESSRLVTISGQVRTAEPAEDDR